MNEEMKITRFDTIEFDVISCGMSGGYYPDDEHAERAIALMNEGVFLDNPKDNWWKSGWKFTDYGTEYYNEFMNKVHEMHGHKWMTNFESNPDMYDDDEYGKRINTFAYSSGFHNGPKCLNCGFEFCKHCDSEMEIPKCATEKQA